MVIFFVKIKNHLQFTNRIPFLGDNKIHVLADWLAGVLNSIFAAEDQGIIHADPHYLITNYNLIDHENGSFFYPINRNGNSSFPQGKRSRQAGAR